jgi:hypothetical protein
VAKIDGKKGHARNHVFIKRDRKGVVIVSRDQLDAVQHIDLGAQQGFTYRRG